MKKILRAIKRFFKIRTIENYIYDARSVYIQALSINDLDTAKRMQMIIDRLKEDIRNVKND